MISSPCEDNHHNACGGHVQNYKTGLIQECKCKCHENGEADKLEWSLGN